MGGDVQVYDGCGVSLVRFPLRFLRCGALASRVGVAVCGAGIRWLIVITLAQRLVGRGRGEGGELPAAACRKKKRNRSY